MSLYNFSLQAAALKPPYAALTQCPVAAQKFDVSGDLDLPELPSVLSFLAAVSY